MSGNAARAGGPGSGNLRLSDGFVLAVNQGYGLAILGEEAAIRDVHQLQHFRIVVQLHRDGMYVLGAGNHQVHGKCVAFYRLNRGWIKQEAGRSVRGSVRSERLPRRSLIGLRLYRWIGGLRGHLPRSRSSSGLRSAHMAQLDGVRGADVDRTLVDLAYIRAADDVRSDGKDRLVRGMIRRRLAKKVLQDWNLS